MLRYLLLFLLFLPVAYGLIQVNPPQPVIELDNTYFWAYVNSSNATMINISTGGTQKKVCIIEDNLSNCQHTFTYASDNWGDWDITATTNHACLYDAPPKENCMEHIPNDLCSDGYTCGAIERQFLMNSPPNLDAVKNITFNYRGTCHTIANITYFLNSVEIASTGNLSVHCTCTPTEYPNVTISTSSLINDTWNFDGLNNITAKPLGTGAYCIAGFHAELGLEFSSGDETTESRTIRVGRFNMTEVSDNCDETPINYPCIKDYDIHYDYSVPQEYRHISTGEDIGSLRANTHVIENMTNLDNKKRMFIWEYGARFYVFDLFDFFNGVRFGYNNIDYGLWHAGMTPHWYKLNSSHWWLGSADYYGVTKIGLWNGTTDTQLFASADEGTTHGEGVWCDVLPEGGDGIPEWITTEESGTVIVYNATPDNLTFTEAYQSSDWGSSSWGFDVHCVDINNDGRKDIFTGDSSGRLRWMNATGSTFSEHTPSTDYGSFYTKLWAGDIDNDNLIEIIHGDTTGNIQVMYWDDASANFINQWTSPDLGYMYHDSSFEVGDYDRDGDLDILTNDYYNDMYLCLQSSATAFSCLNIYNYDYLSYNNDVCTKDREGFCHFVKASGYGGTHITWDLYYPNLFKLIDRQDQYFFKIREDWSSESAGYTVNPFPYDFDGDGDEEVILSGTNGYMLYYDYINYSSFDLKLNYSKELGIVHDYMSRTPETYLVGNTIYCYNDVNVALGETSIILETGSAPSSKQRMTDGLISSDVDKPFEQGSADYVTMTSGKDKWIQLNLSKPRDIGKIKFIGYYHDNRHIQNLSIAVSKDYSAWTTVFNATDEPWLNQGNQKMGLDVYFKPQNLTYVRVYMSGYQDNYDGGALHTNNHITELELYEGNNCSFMFVPLAARGAKSAPDGVAYGITLNPDKEEDYRFFYDISDKLDSTLSSMARWIVQWIT